MASDLQHPIITDVRTAALARRYYPLGTIRCEGERIFRSRLARDLGCLLDLDSAVQSWSCLTSILENSGSYHVPDFSVRYADRVLLIDAVPEEGEGTSPWAATAAIDAGFIYETRSRAEIQAGYRLENARDLLRYARYHVTLGDRIRVLAALEDRGSMAIAECLGAFLDARDPIGGLAVMALRRFVEIDLDDGRIAPGTAVRLFRE